MNNTVYEYVTADEFELPVFVGTSVRDLADQMDIKKAVIYHGLKTGESSYHIGVRGKFIKVNIPFWDIA